MANKRARDRQLAKLAARRQAERRAAQRRRSRIVGAVTAVAVVGFAVAGFALLTGGDGTPKATPSASVSPSAAATGEPTKTGTVTNQADIPKTVACGASAPKTAGEDKPQYSNVPPQQIDPKKTYTATVATSCGDIEVKLDPADTPIAVNNFVYLAQKGFYDGMWFHRIVAGFVIQGGDPLGTGSGGPGYGFTVESNAKLTYTNTGYLLAYANNSQPNSNGSQFFFTIGSQPNLDPPQGPYTAFGQVTKGQDVVDKISKIPTTANPQGEKSTPLQAVYIDSVTITESKQKPASSPSP
jgi:peptidyl-prolyl cis-trans isomerase B (cyclophilin B)